MGEKGNQRLLPSVLNDLHLEDQKMGYLDWGNRQIQSGETFISGLQAEQVGVVSALDVLNYPTPNALDASERARQLYAKRNKKERRCTEIRYGLGFEGGWGDGGIPRAMPGQLGIARPD